MNNLQPRGDDRIGTVPDGLSGTSEEQTGPAGQPFPETSVEGQSTDGHPLHLRGIAPDLQRLAFPVSDLQPDPANAREHGERDLSALAESLRRYGQRKPIVAKRTYRGLSNVVLAGNGTRAAALALNWSHLAVSWFNGTDDEARAYAISDNRTAELSTWDPEALVALQADGLDLLELWHDDAALADLLRENTPPPTFAPQAPTHRLDQLAPDTKCPACGHQFKQEPR